jgi:dTDP-D-glucose 4,6-dehydratase
MSSIAEALAGSWTCSSVKARTHLGWSPAGALAQRLRETAQWYRQAEWL